MSLIIYTSDEAVADAIAASRPDGITIEKAKLVPLSVGQAEIWTLFVHVVGDISMALAAHWLYDAVKEKACRIEKRGQEVHPQEDAIRRAFEDEIEIGRND